MLADVTLKLPYRDPLWADMVFAGVEYWPKPFVQWNEYESAYTTTGPMKVAFNQGLGPIFRSKKAAKSLIGFIGKVAAFAATTEHGRQDSGEMQITAVDCMSGLVVLRSIGPVVLGTQEPPEGWVSKPYSPAISSA